MKTFLMVCGVVLALSGVVGADTIELNADFEAATYALGSVNGQNGWNVWSGNEATVVNTDASQGTQSLVNTLNKPFCMDHALNSTIPVGKTFDFSADVKGKVYMNLISTEGRLVEFGFDGWTPGFYVAGAPGGTVQEGSKPDTDRWITVWGKFYDNGGNMMADLGWCELNQTPFIDGKRVTAYDTHDRAASSLWFVTTNYPGPAGIDHVLVTAVPEPGTLAVMATGLFSLLAYAWRKRR